MKKDVLVIVARVLAVSFVEAFLFDVVSLVAWVSWLSLSEKILILILKKSRKKLWTYFSSIWRAARTASVLVKHFVLAVEMLALFPGAFCPSILWKENKIQELNPRSKCDFTLQEQVTQLTCPYGRTRGFQIFPFSTTSSFQLQPPSARTSSSDLWPPAISWGCWLFNLASSATSSGSGVVVGWHT